MAAGCTTSEAGQATSGTSSAPPTSGSETSSSAPATSSSADIPPPPRELSLAGLDPCTLLTDAQKTQLKISSVSPKDDGGDAIYDGMKECVFDADAAEPFITYDVIAVTDVDVSYWIDQPHNADVELISIDGFPAAEFHTMGVEDSDCAVAIGVAKNQHLHVEMAPLSEDLKQEQICQGTEQAARMALQTLQTLK
jgi:hypothetical protein